MGFPIPTPLWGKMKFHHGDGDAINQAIGILGDIQSMHNEGADLVDGMHQIASPTIEA